MFAILLRPWVPSANHAGGRGPAAEPGGRSSRVEADGGQQWQDADKRYRSGGPEPAGPRRRGHSNKCSARPHNAYTRPHSAHDPFVFQVFLKLLCPPWDRGLLTADAVSSLHTFTAGHFCLTHASHGAPSGMKVWQHSLHTLHFFCGLHSFAGSGGGGVPLHF
jgi:hypothetical protein